MIRTRLRIDGQVFLLSDTIDVDDLKQQMVSAVQAGPAFVNFDTHAHGTVSVLMTPLVPVRFESMEKTEEEVDDWVETTPTFDLDGYGAF